jgi:hypothetical protein
VSLGDIAIQGVLGAQINNQWGVYAIPSIDFPVGKLVGIGAGIGVLADFTFPGLPIGLAAGPELGAVVAISGACSGANCTGTNTVSDFGGAFYGARLRFAYYPVIFREGWRRRALALGLDLRFLFGAFGAADTTGTAKAAIEPAFAPMLSIGYAAF